MVIVMWIHRYRDCAVILVVLGILLTAPAASACSIVHSANDERRDERAAFAKADMVVTIDAVTESYMPVPGPAAGHCV